MTGAELITQERTRQINQEGWTLEQDQRYTQGDLWRAAMCYILPQGFGRSLNNTDRGFIPDGTIVYWPFGWDGKYWKPSPDDRVRELTKAGALIAAEIDRLQST